MELKVEEVSLANVGGGTLEKHFKEMLIEAQSIFADCEAYEAKQGQVIVGMNFTLDLVYSQSSNSITVYARGGMKKPPRKLSVRGLIHREGKFFIYDEGEQQSLFPKKKEPTPLRTVEK